MCRSARSLLLAGLLVLGVAPRLLAAGPVLRIVYFTPSDREAIPGYAARVTACVQHVADFYRQGMAANGLGERTFALDMAGDVARIELVKGAKKLREYGRDSFWEIADEVRRAVGPRGIDLNREYVLVVTTLLLWDGNKAVEVGPYAGSGAFDHGICLVYDDERISAANLPDKTTPAWYNGPCSLGQFNSHYIGGFAHELGHAFGLPHDKETSEERRTGISLMGSGNHTFGNELRGEKPSTILSRATAVALARQPLFRGGREGLGGPISSSLSDLAWGYADGKITLSGRVTAKPAPYAVIAYNDDDAIKADYDAIAWTATPDRDGRFKLAIGDLRRGSFELRLRVCLDSGAWDYHSFHYSADENGKPDLSLMQRQTLVAAGFAALDARDRAAVAKVASQLEALTTDATATAQGRLLRRLAAPPTPADPATVADGTASIALSDLRWTAAATGWGQPLRDQVWREDTNRFLTVGGRFFDRGLFAHAPAGYTFATAGRWKRLVADYGLQDGHDGAVRFIVRADGREIWRSEPVADHQVRHLDLPIDGVKSLELRTALGGESASGTWGVWLAPRLER